MTREQTTEALTSAGLKLGTVGAKESKDAKVGTVVTQSPAAGGVTQAGGAVQIELAVKPAAVPVPDVVGMSAASRSPRARRRPPAPSPSPTSLA